ncbi:hypothetical protein LTT66_23635 [Nocardia gipuzkoensis]|uniref:hypothetical protein n=1 Tax=Nocardia gipuzkoensis TaxID=2749991 RepID=UPI001E3FE5B3|nr:hypothetical protein [Nocardia gipuzkoensis]UGT66277.1 hypothetical protein LTT66_23635 [Nocardia gipuzkoensis]
MPRFLPTRSRYRSSWTRRTPRVEDRALISAWHAPDGVLISHDEVAAWAAAGAAAPASHRVGGLAQADARLFPGDALDALGLDEQSRKLYLDGNARRVFGLTGWPLGANALARRRVAGVLGVLPRLGP